MTGPRERRAQAAMARQHKRAHGLMNSGRHIDPPMPAPDTAAGVAVLDAWKAQMRSEVRTLATVLVRDIEDRLLAAIDALALPKLPATAGPRSEAAVPLLLSAHDLAELMRCSPSTISRMVRDGKFPKPLASSKPDRWLASDYDTWLSAAVERRARP
jgi:predicted DNA-binding transcriptional regulator AlpA